MSNNGTTIDLTNVPTSELYNFLTADVLPDSEPVVPSELAGLIAELNATPDQPDTLAQRTYRIVKRDGTVTEWTAYYSSDATTTEVPAHFYDGSAGKNVVGTKLDEYDRTLHDMALVRGGTRVYIPLKWKRDSVGFKTVDRSLATKIRRAAERLAIVDRAAHHRFDYARFTILPASDDAPADVAGYVRIVFTGTRVK